MSTDEAPVKPLTPTPNSNADSSNAESKKRSASVFLIPYPKFIFMYPTLIVSVIAAIVMYFGGYHAVDPDTQSTPVVMTGLFLVVMLVNMFVIVFDFPRSTSLTLLFILLSIGLGLWVLSIGFPSLMPAIANWLSGIRPVANTTFYVCTALVLMCMYVAVLISVRFNYWELSNNELLHHHGFLSDLKRYPAPNLRIDKEINDVFEYILLGAGRLILHPSTEKRAIVLDNILFVTRKERELTRVLGSIKVRISGDSDSENQE